MPDRQQELLSWRWLVASAARGAGARMLDGPLSLTIEFRLPAPVGRRTRTEAQRARWLRPWRRPDLSKLIRAVEDALTGIAYRDDAQVVAIVARKVYAEPVGAEIDIAGVTT